MYVEIKPESRLHEVLAEFCTIIGGGWVKPQKEEIYSYILDHPINPDRQLIVYLDRSVNPFAGGTIFIRELGEGVMVDSLEDWPLVHYFTDPAESDRPLFPYAVDIHEFDVTYHYKKNFDAGTIMSIRTPKEVYARLKSFFDDVNELPWLEREDPDHDLPIPELPKEGSDE